MDIKTTSINLIFLYYFLLIINTKFVNTVFCYKQHHNCYPRFNNLNETMSTISVYHQYLLECPTETTECKGPCISFYYKRHIFGCSTYLKNNYEELAIHGNETEDADKKKKDLILLLIAKCQINQRSYATKDGELTYLLECCYSDYCNKRYVMNCYLSAEVWESENYKLSRHFPLDFCGRLHFSFDYNVLTFEHFLKDPEDFKKHLNKLPMPTQMFMEMILALKFKVALLEIVFSIGTINNPFNQHDLAMQIEREFQQAIGSKINRQKFASNCKIFMEQFNVNAVDISHPYPNMSAISDFFNKIRLHGYLTLFPSPTPMPTFNLSAKVKEDKDYFNEIQRNSVQINLAYDYEDMNVFVYSLFDGRNNFKTITLGTKLMLFNQNRKKYDFNGTLYQICNRLYNKNVKYVNSNNDTEFIITITKHLEDYHRFYEEIYAIVIFMNYFHLPGLSVMFLDWDSYDCGGRRFMAMNLLNNLLNSYKNESFYKENLNFTMDNKQLTEEIETYYGRQIQKYNYFNTTYKFMVGIIAAVISLFTILLLIYKAFFVKKMIYQIFNELPSIFVELGYDLNSNHFKIKESIGNGAFSEVYLVKYTGRKSIRNGNSERRCLLSTLPNKKFAAKVISVHKEGEIHILREFERMNECTHEFIVKAYGVTLLDRQIAVVMEYLPNGNLLEHLKSLKELPQRETIFSWCRCIVKAMKYLHARQDPILHRDLAARNCLFIDQEKTQLKISDFGLARNTKYGTGCDTRHYEGELSTSNLAWAWIAKEIVCSETNQIFFTKASDVWSFGILLWEICSLGAVPYPVSDPYDRNKIKNWLERQGVPRCPCSEAKMIYDNLITPCWLDPPERITFEDLEEIIDENNGIPINPPTRKTTRAKTLALDPNPSTSNADSMDIFAKISTAENTTTATIDENNANSSTTSNVTQGPTLEEGITILPARKIVFNYPFNQPCFLEIRNSGEKPIFYQLKATNTQRLRIQPTKGILDPNKSVKIDVSCEAVNCEMPYETMENDCIIVEWNVYEDFKPEILGMVRRNDVIVEYNI